MAFKFYSAVTHKLRYWLAHKLSACQEMVPLMSASLERRLTVGESIKLKLHLWICLYCARYLEQLKTMRVIINRKSTSIANDELTFTSLNEEARARLRRSLEKQNFGG